jgi:electron transport complex protein RnfG
VGIGLGCALLIVTVYQATATRIADNEARALAEAVAAVLPGAQTLMPVTLTADDTLQVTADAADPLPVFLGYDSSGRLIGAAVTAAGMGYQDTIRIIYAYAFDRQAIVGLRVLESKETPGLGDKIETDPVFQRNFANLDVTLSEDGSQLAHPIETVPAGEKVAPWQIDAITGATISSDAIGDMLNRSAGRWVPALARDARNLPLTVESGGS